MIIDHTTRHNSSVASCDEKHKDIKPDSELSMSASDTALIDAVAERFAEMLDS